MNDLILLLMSVALLAGGPDPDQLACSAASQPIREASDSDSSRARIDRLRARHLRRRIRDLRLEVEFVEARIAAVPAAREQALVRVRVNAVNAAVDEQVVGGFFDERKARLQERLSLLNRQLAAAEKRLHALTGDVPFAPAVAEPGVDENETSLTKSEELR